MTVATRSTERWEKSSRNRNRRKVAEHLRRNGPDTVRGIAIATSLHPRTVRATILAGAGELSPARFGRYGRAVASFSEAGMCGQAKLWRVDE